MTTAEPEYVLSMHAAPDLLQYRVLRGDRFLYVAVHVPALIPPAERSCARALRHLQLVPAWRAVWQTLTVVGPVTSPRSRMNLFRPHRLAPELLDPALPRFSLAGFAIERRIWHRRLFVSRVRLSEDDDGSERLCVVKIAESAGEIATTAAEIAALLDLGASPPPPPASRRPEPVFWPRFYGYVFEETPDRVVGFVMEFLEGRPAEHDDLPTCVEVLHQVHRRGRIHGNVGRKNWMRTADGMKLLDWERSHVLWSPGDAAPQDEIRALRACLAEETASLPG